MQKRSVPGRDSVKRGAGGGAYGLFGHSIANGGVTVQTHLFVHLLFVGCGGGRGSVRVFIPT
jgi:hypothetical protein